MSSELSYIRRICAAQQRRNAVTINAIGWVALVGGGVLVVDVVRPVGDVLWAAGAGLAIGAGLSMLAVDIVFRRLDSKHPVLDPGLHYTEYEFVEAEADEGGAGEGERRADKAPSEGGAARAQGLSPLLVEVETVARSRAGKSAEPQEEKPEADQHAGPETGRDAGDGNGRAGGTGKPVPGLERLSRPDPRHSDSPNPTLPAAIQPGRASSVER